MIDIPKNGVRMHTMCRGTGKVFAVLDLPILPDGTSVKARSELADGSEVPSKLLPYKGSSRVLVLPVLNVAQTVSVCATYSNGKTEVLLRRRIHPGLAKITSQVHTALRDQRVESVRNYDLFRSISEYGIRVERILPVDDEVDFVQCVAKCTHDDLEALRAEVRVRAISPEGKDIMVGECLFGPEILSPEQDTESYYKRIVQFSFRIPHSLKELIIWIGPKDAGKSSPSGFIAKRDFEMRDTRYFWAQHTEPAIECDRYPIFFGDLWSVDPVDLDIQRATHLSVHPLFSIVSVLQGANPTFVDEMIESVLAQSYESFELLLVNANPGDAKLTRQIGEWCMRDARIHNVAGEEGLGLAENTNMGIRAAQGDFLGFIEQGDMLAPDALYRYAHALEEYPETDLFYSDEDCVKKDGSHVRPYFKTDWNPDLLLGVNYVGHFLAVRKSVVDGLELPSRDYEGAHDYCLTLQVSEKARNVYHCRRVLYHSRLSNNPKGNAFEAGLLAVQAHLDRCGVNARAVPCPRLEGRYEIEYALGEEPLVSILIPNKDASALLDTCVTSILEKTEYQNYEVVIIENNSTEPETFEYYERVQERDKRVRVVYYDLGGGFNFARIINFGAAKAEGDFYLFLNNDTEVIAESWLTRMVSLGLRKGTGIVGAKLLFFDKTIQHMGVACTGSGPNHMGRFLPYDAPQDSLQLMQDFTAVTGACLLVSRTVYEQSGGLDEEFEVDYNDVDFCYKVYDAGYQIVCDPSVLLYHHESITRGHHTSKKSKMRFEREKALLRIKWPHRFVFPDPANNPNFDELSLYWRLK